MKNDKSRIRKAFKNLRDQGIEATANFDSEKEINRWGRYREVILDTKVYDLRRQGRSVSNGLDDDGNIKDTYGNMISFNVLVSYEDDVQTVKDALEAEGLFVLKTGTHSITVGSHKTPEYENARFNRGFEVGFNAVQTPTFDSCSPRNSKQFIEGWVAGAFDRIQKKDLSIASGVMQNYNNLYTTLGREEANRLVVPMLEALILKFIETEDSAYEMEVYTR